MRTMPLFDDCLRYLFVQSLPSLAVLGIVKPWVSQLAQILQETRSPNV